MSPLSKRLPRELKHNLGKWLGLFLLITMAIALVSGFLTVAHSIQEIVDDMREDYTVEDGRFTTAYEASEEALATAEELGLTIYESFYLDLDFSSEDGNDDCTVRVYIHRTEVNIAAYAQGEAPSAADEVAIDRVFAANNGIEVGDVVEIAGQEFTVTGILTLPDYQALFETNTSFTYNALTFAVCEVTQEGFDALVAAQVASVSYTYSFVMDDRDLTVSERTSLEADLVATLTEAGVTVTDILDADANQALTYLSDDLESDTAMWTMLGELFIVLMGFLFVVLTSYTIEEESAVIGTLLASGVRKRELVTHYLTLPCSVGVAGAAVGNALGYTAFVELMRGVYYNSYSIPPYEAAWSWEAFALTTAVPLALLVVITLAGLLVKLRRTPLQFLRHERAQSSSKRALPLPARLGFVGRFRLRVLLANAGNFLALFLGVGFAGLILLFGICIMPSVEAYTSQLRDTVPAEHLYSLKAPLELEGSDEERAAWAAVALLASVDDISDLGLTDEELAELLTLAATVDAEGHAVNTTDNGEEAIAQAEKFAATTLEYERNDGDTETVGVYGLQEDSAYWTDIDVADGAVTVGAGLAEKYGIAVGDTITLYDKFEDIDRAFTVDAIAGSSADMNLYLSLTAFNETFGNEADYFNGWASDLELSIDALYLAGETAPEDMDALAAQMNDSMGNMVWILVGAAVIIYLLFMYLLTKTVIDRNARSISRLKVLGYRDREVNRVYLRLLTITVCVALVATLPLIHVALEAIWASMLESFTGNIGLVMPAEQIAVELAVGLATYALVAFTDIRRIRRVPLSLALKTQE